MSPEIDVPMAVAGFGWNRDQPDFRDYTVAAPHVGELLRSLGPTRSDRKKLPARVDLREFFPRVRHQYDAHSSTGFACVALLEYFERRALGKSAEYAPLFLYKTARNLAQVAGDEGVELRTSLKALRRFGVPPERFWPSVGERVHQQPDAFVFASATPRPELCYVRLDSRNCRGAETLATVRAMLAAGFPAVFGFPVPNSISHEADIPYRPTFDSILGGQAVVAVGYDDTRLRATKGALLVRNSWGPNWGEGGYGWLPYSYVSEQLAVDFWTLLSRTWLDSGEFRRPRL